MKLLAGAMRSVVVIAVIVSATFAAENAAGIREHQFLEFVRKAGFKESDEPVRNVWNSIISNGIASAESGSVLRSPVSDNASREFPLIRK